MTALADSGTQQAPTPGGAGSMTLAELGRWVWRALTSMRVALFLLFLLAVAAVPGSVVPQREANPLAAADWAERNPELAQWAERLGLFDVYSTPWFSAIYLLLMISLVGCIIPRVGVHWRALRTRPPAPPSRLTRLPAHREDVLENPPQVVLDAAARANYPISTACKPGAAAFAGAVGPCRLGRSPVLVSPWFVQSLELRVQSVESPKLRVRS